MFIKILKNIEKNTEDTNVLLQKNLKNIEDDLKNVDIILTHMQNIVSNYGTELDNHEQRITVLESKVK